MERHSLHNIEENEITETKNMFPIPLIKEEIEIITEINDNSNESCSNENDNSIPYCNILLSKFLDLTPENNLTPLKNKVNADEMRKRNAEKQKHYRERQKLQNLRQLYSAIPRKSNAEQQKLYRERLKLKKNESQDGKKELDMEVAINKRKKKAEQQRRWRERHKLKEVDIEVAINKRKRRNERKKLLRERMKLEKDELYLADRRKKAAERTRLYKERRIKENPELYFAKRAEARKLRTLRKKMEENKLQDVNEQVDIEIAINKRKRNAEKQKIYRERKKLENN